MKKSKKLLCSIITTILITGSSIPAFAKEIASNQSSQIQVSSPIIASTNSTIYYGTTIEHITYDSNNILAVFFMP